jgi:2-polyprenyl-6-methoxyphenol hydroxylase-like FAD-dependent oxidoreductase
MNGIALISAAGVVGLALAYWLDRAGFAKTIVERSAEFLRGGQAVDIRGVALDMVDAMGLLDDARALRMQLKGMSHSTPTQGMPPINRLHSCASACLKNVSHNAATRCRAAWFSTS